MKKCPFECFCKKGIFALLPDSFFSFPSPCLGTHLRERWGLGTRNEKTKKKRNFLHSFRILQIWACINRKIVLNKKIYRGVAQPGSAPALGAGSRRFKSSRPDHLSDLQIPSLFFGNFLNILEFDILPVFYDPGQINRVRSPMVFGPERYGEAACIIA